MSEQFVPEIRVAGFDEPWARAALGSVAQLNPDENIPDEFEYVDLASVVGTRVINHRTESRVTAPSRAQRLARKDDIFYQTVRPYQKNNVVFGGASKPFVFSSGYAQIRTPCESGFLFAAMQRPEFVSQVIDRCTGTSFPAIAPSALGEVLVPVCRSGAEQRSIAATFTNLDSTTSSHEQKRRQLKQAKASLMQRMFPAPGETEPEIRFEGFTGAWQERRLGAMASEFRSGDFIPAREIHLSGAYPVFGGNGKRGYTNVFNHAGLFVLIGRQGALCGNVRFSVGKAYFTEHAIAVKGNAEHDTRFLGYLFATLNLGQYSAQSAQPGLAVGSVREVKALAPSLAEQRAIGAFFSKLDDLIEAEAQYVSKLQQVKSALLQKMFV